MKKLQELLGYPIQSTARPFKDLDGNNVTLCRLVSLYPSWAKRRILALEKSLAELHDASIPLEGEDFTVSLEGDDFNKFVRDKVKLAFRISK